MLYLAMPFVLLRLFWRSRRLPAYRLRIKERFGFYPLAFERSLWIHGVSMGETLAAVPLIKALQARYPSLPIIVTTMTSTGAAQVKASFGDTVTHFYIPYDLPDAVDRFLNATQPVLNVTMETELWPNMFAACRQKNIPICLMNARLSEKSANGYERIASMTREMLQTVQVIAAHGREDAERFIALGAPDERVVVTGNIKFDITIDEQTIEKGNALRAALGKNRFIWVAASTHEGEEEIILDAHKQLLALDPQALLILVPRHPDRFDSVSKLVEQSFTVERRSQTETCQASVYLGDTMGELLILYSVADVAFVGGSLIPRGGHNMLEPGVLGKPILTGPHLFNFKEISELFIAAQALKRVDTANSLADQLCLFLQRPDERTESGNRARQVVESNRGALAKQLEIIYRVVDANL
jgi:3-deoxy-D-manno-octulosonic-acid transferase